MNLYQLASQDEAWGAYALDDDTTPWTAWPADPPAPVPPGPVPIDAALDAAAREYGVNADVLRALGPGSSVDSIFDTAASLRSRLEAFGGDYAQALASYRQEDEGNGGNALAAPAAAPLSPPPQADARMPAPAPVPAPAPSGRPTAVAPRPARPQATAPVPGPPPSQSARQHLPAAPADGRLNAVNDPRSLLYSQAPAAPKPFVEEVKSQLASGAKTLAQMLPGTGAAARWVANQPEPTTGKAPPASVGSVLEHEALPAAVLPSRDLPLRPETRQAANNAWDAASPQDRQRLQSLPGWQGQLARERAAQFAQADKGIFAASPTATLFDTRVEGRTKTLIAKGEHPDFARRAAYEGAAAGVAPGQEVKALGGTVQPSTYDFETKNLFDPNRPANLLNTTVGRGVAKGALGLGKGVVGIAQLIEDGMGADDATKQRTADRANALRSMEQAIGERGTHLQRNAEGAIASITQQLPMLVTGSFVPSQLLAMGSIAAQSFGQEYSDGKSRGLDPQQAAGRAGAFAAFEVIGEKFGLKGNLEAIRKATQGMPSDAVAGFLANQVKKEIPGEVLTTTGQFAVDKWAPAGMALNPNATFEDYFRQMGDTITQTVMQGGMMSGGRRVLGGVSATAPPAPSAPRVQDQSTTPNAPHAQESTYESGTGSTTAPAPAPSPASTAPATGYDGVPVPGNATWSDVTTATRKAQPEAEILRQAEALPAQESATSTATAPAPAAPPATPPAPMQASTDGNHGSTQQSADASPQVQVNHDADRADTSPQASGAQAPAPTPAAADAEASAADTAPATTQHGSARHAEAAQVQPPAHAVAPIDAQIQALDSGMLVIGGDQATILAHLQAGGVRGAEPFMGTTIVPVDQAALAQQGLSRPLAATAGPRAGTGSRHAPTRANLAQASAAAQRAPAARRGATPTAGSDSTAGSSTAGASAPHTGHGSPANAANAGTFQPVPVMEMQRDGTLMVKGDPVQLQERLRKGGVDSVLRRKGGVLVGLDQVDKARQLFSNPQSTQDRSRAAPPTSAVARREVAPSQSDSVAENHSNGYSDNDGRVQEPTQPDDGRGPTTGLSRATSLDSVRGIGNAVPTGTASLVGPGFAGRIQPADDQGTSQGILRRSGGASLPRRTATLVGLGIAERIERAGSQALLGEQVDSPQRLAELAQVYRDPRFETFRVFFIKDGQVVHATGVSARLPGETPMVPAGMTFSQYIQEFRDNMQRTGADGYYVLHNHPSGNPRPSPEDLNATAYLEAHVPGLLAHVVINSNKYAVIEPTSAGASPDSMVRLRYFGDDNLLKASRPMAVLGEEITGSDDFAIVGKSMQRPGWITLIGTGADGKVRAISEAPASILTRSYPYLAATVRRFMRQSGSGSVFAMGDAGDIGSRPVRDALAAGILRDALPDAGRTLHQQGVHTGGTGFSLTRGRRVAEGGPAPISTSAAKMEMQLDGTLMVKGDSVQLEERLRQGGVDSVLRRKGGVLVGLDQVSKARKLLQQSARSQASASPSLPSLPSQQFKRSESLLQDGSYAAPTSKAEDGSSPASRYSNRSTPPKAELSLERIDQVIQETLAGLAGAPPVKAVGSPGDIGLVVPAEVVASGITLGSGDIYVFQSGVGSDLDVRLVVFHELLHRGVRFLVPRAQYVQTMLDLAARDTRVQQYANEWKRTGIVPQQREQLARLGYKGSELQGQLEAMAIEEGLARISEELNVDVSMGTRWKPSRIRALAQWLTTVADKAGMAKLAQAIRAMTYNEAERFVMRAIDHAGAAGGDIENSGRARSSTRSPQNPWTQPVDSARLEMQRDGTLMVKGDPAQLQKRLRQGGVHRVLRREGDVLVGLDQVDKARKWLQQSPRAQDLASPSLPPPLPGQGQQFSRNAPDRASQTKGLPSQPATVQSVRAAVAKLTNSMGLLAEGHGRVVVATSADIKAHWEPLIGEVDIGSQDKGLARGFHDPHTNTVFLIADHIEAGQEMAVAAHELVHKHGKAVLGEKGWRQLHEVIGTWANRPEGSLERRVHDEAVALVKASQPDDADAATYSSEELFPYTVQVAMELGVQPTALMPNNSVQGWLARVRAAMRGAWDKLTNKPELFDSQDLVDLAFAVAQRENPAYASEFDEPSAPVAPRPGITAQQAQDIVNKVLKGLGMRGTVTPVIVQNPTAAGLVAPEGMPSGGVSEGRLYLFLEGIRDEVEGFRVVFHELFHLGLSQSITSQEYRQTMLHLLADPLVRKYAARWKTSQDGHSRRGSMPVNNWHALAVEEALADLTEEIHHERGGIGTREMTAWVRRTIAWIADLAHQWGMPKVARRLRGMTLTQAEAFVVGTVLKARTGAPVLLPDARWASSRNGRDPAAAEAAYELMYQRGQVAMGETGWEQLLGPIDAWADATEGSTERQIHDEAVRLMQASLHSEEATAYGAAQALFPYAVQAALQMRIQPMAKEPAHTAAGWLARVRGGLRSAWNKLATEKGDFNSMDLVDLAFGLAQQENPVHRPELDAVAQALADKAAQLLSSISGAEDLFSLPRSRKDTVADIAAEHSPSIEVRKTDLAGETKYTLLLPDGTVATVTSREPTPHEVFGMDDASGQWITERPGEKAPPVGARSDVWVDVSRLEPGKWGGVIYNIAATFAHNTGRIFIGDPSGLKDIALRRRSEQMLSSALKFGTTDHLAPHPRQVAGDARLGVPPLGWVYGDSVGNIQRLIDVNLAALDNAVPDARNLTYDLDTGHFIDARTGDRLSKEALARSFNAGRTAGAIQANGSGWRTVARGAVLRALLGRWADSRKEQGAGQRAESGPDRSEVLDGAGRQSDQPASPRNGEFERGRGTLAGIAEQRDRLASDDREQRIFYSRNRRPSEVAQ